MTPLSQRDCAGVAVGGLFIASAQNVFLWISLGRGDCASATDSNGLKKTSGWLVSACDGALWSGQRNSESLFSLMLTNVHYNTIIHYITIQ